MCIGGWSMRLVLFSVTLNNRIWVNVQINIIHTTWSKTIIGLPIMLFVPEGKNMIYKNDESNSYERTKDCYQSNHLRIIKA